jgi:hypothetical protein
MADESHTAKSPGRLLPLPPAAEPSPRAPVGIGSRPVLLALVPLPPQLPREGDAGSSRIGEMRSARRSGMPQPGEAVGSKGHSSESAHDYQASEVREVATSPDRGTADGGDGGRSKESGNESSRLWRKESFLAEFGGRAYTPSTEGSNVTNNLSSGLRALSGVVSNLGRGAQVQESSAALAAVLDWAGSLEAKMEAAYGKDRDDEKKVKALEIAEEILKKVQELFVDATSGEQVQQQVHLLVVPCGWTTDSQRDVDRAVTLMLRVAMWREHTPPL